jgi:SHAQKYF class myb-like DNA-binding protein|uniref:Uncharacterized protein n=1 Tax=Globisporangium ultimum (strain ATCC 200006 / CBS 805.95 / DAOM BR144) TaxID=431595 RepID=K3WCZ3_GLOUD
MVITSRVKSQYFENEQSVIRIAPKHSKPNAKSKRVGTPWTPEEHDRFLHALEHHPSGPWKLIAEFVATRTTRQTMTHAQKYRERISRQKKASEGKDDDRLRNSLCATRSPSTQEEQLKETGTANALERSDAFLLSFSEIDDIYDAMLATFLDASYETDFQFSNDVGSTEANEDLDALMLPVMS